MKILFDHGTPVPLRRLLSNHSVDTAYELGWAELENGELLDRAEAEGYEVLITTDQNLRHQQNLSDRKLAVLTLMSTSWPRIQLRGSEIQDAIDEIGAGELMEIRI